jgi:uncharacterized membrane protein SpoIIM required for sporulation
MISYLINPEYAEKRPLLAIGLGFLISLFAIGLTFAIVPDQSSWVSVIFVVLLIIPLIVAIEKNEEKRDITESVHETTLLREHGTVITFLLFWFIGVTIAFSLVGLIGGAELTNNLFETQQNTLLAINGKATEQNFQANMRYFKTVFFNNIRVMILCLVTSFLFGFGAIFILTWNATVIAAALIDFINIKLNAPGIFMPTLGHYVISFIHGFFRYFIHGAFEMSGFFMGGLAGSIIGFSIINKDYRSQKFERIILDTNILIVIAIGLIFFAGLIETFISPLLY